MHGLAVSQHQGRYSPRRPIISRSIGTVTPAIRPRNWRLHGVPVSQPIAFVPSFDLSEEIAEDNEGEGGSISSHGVSKQQPFNFSLRFRSPFGVKPQKNVII